MFGHRDDPGICYKMFVLFKKRHVFRMIVKYDSSAG